MDLIDSLNDFETRLREYLPASEAGVREILAQSLRYTLNYGVKEVEVEASFGFKRHDVLVHPAQTAIELKYHRSTASGTNRPLTMQYGQLLADVRKLAANPALESRLLVLITDRAGATHLRNKALLPATWDRSREITAANVAGLARSAGGPASAAGPWIDAEVRLIWQTSRAKVDEMYGYAWDVHPIASI